MKLKKLHIILTLASGILALFSCQKAITIELPDVEQDYVVEGTIEIDNPPLVILTQTQGYFEDASAESIFGSFVHGADIKVINNGTEYPLIEICTNDLPDTLLDDVSALTGIPEESLSFFNYCVYTSLDPNILGEENQFYDLEININDEFLTSSTKIPYAVPLDSVWFKPVDALDSLGFVWAGLDDPDTTGNFYRWYAQRINIHTFGEEVGTVKDPFPIPPLGSIFDDKFFNGIYFDFAYNRGEIGALEGQDDEGPEEGYFKSGDTVVVKFSSTTRDNFLYIRALENQAGTAGSPFASPGNLPFNINGGLGSWAGYAPTFDTLICQ